MLKKTIKYTDFNGVDMEENFYFNISKAELTELQLKTPGGYGAYIEKIVAAKDVPTLARLFKELILMSYGEKSDDGKRFVKVTPDGHRLADDFVQTEAYSELYMELVTDDKAAAAFVNGIIPQSLDQKVIAAQNADHPALKG